MTNTLEFSQQLALSLYESSEEFPIAFEDAYLWLGYSRKDAAKRMLLNHFIEGVDYQIHIPVEVASSKGSGIKETIKLTANCLKEFGMLAGTEQGKNIRRYFLECEKLAKKVTESINPALLECLNNMQREMKTLTARTQRLDDMEKATKDNKGIKGVIDTKIEDTFSDDLQFTTREYLEYKGVSLVHLNTLRKRAIQFYRNGTQEDLPKKGKGNKEVVFKGAAIAYLEEALKTILF